MATALPHYYCHKCQAHIGHVTNFECPHCQESFIEEVATPEPASQTQQRQNASTFAFHNPQFGHTTILIGGSSGNDEINPGGHGDLQNFLQSVLTQLTHGLTGGATTVPAFPFAFNSPSGATFMNPSHLDAFLTQFINQMGENSGPAPASESRINSIPTVKVTSEQARDNLQCAICMDDFKENDEAKRLPCSHHFHEPCISRWLRMHGTCPTCRVTLDGDNTTNNDFFNFQSNQQQTQNNRRNDRGNNGSSSSTSMGGFNSLEFD